MSEAPATPAPAGEAPAGASTEPPAATPPAVTPPATPAVGDPATPTPPASADDLGDGPDGDPQQGETDTDKYKRIARREQREKREAVEAATRTATEASTRAEAAEQALKAAQDAAKELPGFKDQVTDLTVKVTEKDLQLLRYTVGSEKGLTMKQAQRLKGDTAEALAADADAFIADNAMPGHPGGRPAPNSESDSEFLARMNRNRT